MNSKENYFDDPLKHFIHPDSREKTPDGFTSKVMTRIQMESVPLIQTEKSQTRNPVPFISAAITLLLIAATFIIPSGKSDSFSLLLLDQIRNIKITFPVIDFKSIFNFSVSNIIFYVFIGILILTLFDRVLYLVIHRKEES